MRMQRWKIAAIVVAVVAGGAGYTRADVGASVDPGYAGFAAWRSAALPHDQTSADYQSIGWRFFVNKPIVITHVGLFDFGDNGLSCAHQMGIWGVRRAADAQGNWIDLLRGPLPIGPGGTTENHYVYVSVGGPLTMTPDDPTYGRLLIGVWTGSGNTEQLVLSPFAAVAWDAQTAGVITHQNYTYALPPTYGFARPWGYTDDCLLAHHFGVNFKYNLLGPSADAGPDVSIYTSEQAVTTIYGVGTNTAPNTPMQYRWLEAGTVLQDWAEVEANGVANLNLATLATAFSIESHTLTLEVRDTTTTASDTMILTVTNTPPEAQLAPTYQVVEIAEDAILITAEVADFDGDTLSYQWVKGGEVLDSGTITPPAGGAVIALDDLVIDAGDPRFPLGLNDVQLVVSDSVNPSVAISATTKVKDTTAPTLAPTASTTMLWPPNHELVPVTISAYTEDNGGGLITLSATVQSSEPLDGSTEEDCTVASVDNGARTVLVQLRAERSGSGDGRVYTITITATDASGNASTATVEVRVPHDKRKK